MDIICAFFSKINLLQGDTVPLKKEMGFTNVKRPCCIELKLNERYIVDRKAKLPKCRELSYLGQCESLF